MGSLLVLLTSFAPSSYSLDIVRACDSLASVARLGLHGTLPPGIQALTRGGIGLASLVREALGNLLDLRAANTVGADHYFHCKATCMMARRGYGPAVLAIGIGELHELLDEHVQGADRASCDRDRAANELGQIAGMRMLECPSACKPYRPHALGELY